MPLPPPKEPIENLDDYREWHQRECGGLWVESYIKGQFHGTGHYHYRCPDCGESYDTDSSD